MTHPIATYLDVAGISDPDERRSELEKITAPDVTYADAHAPDVIRGRGALAAFLAIFHERVPDKRFEAARPIEHFHHGYRQAWTLIDKNTGAQFSAGTFTGTVNSAGQLDIILGFIDEEPATSQV